MASTYHASPSPAQMAHRPSPASQIQQAPASNAPAGTFTSGTKVQVGSHRVVIEKYLSEGGFAHVYVVRVPVKDSKYELAVLKRVAVPDKEALASMRTEVDTMKKLKGHKHIVRYIDSHASQLKGGGYEVFLLMEFCAGGGLIDFMNTRLQYRLTEPEILNIFSDVAEGVATMHYLKPPLLHRDLKVENVLISKPPSSSSNALYKLCDFGSSAPPRPAATNTAEGRLIEDDIQRHTTMQYRSPEMVDVWRKLPIDEKSDIWALGVLLYKLCYYTTPFEEVGQMAILNAKFKFPHHPQFSHRLRALIGAMLKEDPRKRPNIYQVVQEVCNIRGTPVPIVDIYSGRTEAEAARNQELPPKSPQLTSPPPAVGISHSPPKRSKETLPDITPMRRGRPTTTLQQPVVAKASPGPSPVRGDPFAALDSSSITVRTEAVDELSKKFPSLDEFSIALDKGSGFDFSKTMPTTRTHDAISIDASGKPQAGLSRQSKAADQLSNQTGFKPSKASDPLTVKAVPAIKPKYVSTGTMTSTTPSPQIKAYPDVSKRPIWRVPTHHRSESQPRPSTKNELDVKESAAIARSLQTSPRPDEQRQSSATGNQDASAVRSERDDMKSSATIQRPVSGAFVGSNLDFLRDHEINLSKSPPLLGSRKSSQQRLASGGRLDDRKHIENDTMYLRDLEENEDLWERNKLNSSSVRSKRASMPPGQLNEILIQFEAEEQARQESLQRGNVKGGRPLSPVAASEATSSSPRNTPYDTSGLEELEDLPPEMRREIERQQAQEEERRVTEAAAKYRNNPTAGSVTRASTIQQRVQSLLDEGRQSPVQRTAAGYGHYTDESAQGETPVVKRRPPERTQIISPSSYTNLTKAPVAGSQPSQRNELPIAKQRQDHKADTAELTPSISAPTFATGNRTGTGTRPAAKPKPAGLRNDAIEVTSPDATAADLRDWERDFSRRYPSLSGLNMEETEIKGIGIGSAQRGMRVKDV
ncbi:hypothetical protein ANO11243_063010 [Dothideomycetidae sp. 11243]|nr:hypothetical protein ANO11243_063010 [fungal sp. No.11243]